MGICRQDNSFALRRYEDENSIIGLLLGQQPNSSSCCDDDVSVIPIVGDAGLGKTTLAELVYEDARVQDNFDVRMWVSFSDCYLDVLRLTSSLVNSAKGIKNDKKKKRQRKARIKARKENFAVGNLTPILDNNFKLEKLQSDLGKLLFKKKFLLVLDNVSNEICCHWDVLKVPLKTGANTSKILVTTRSTKVSSTLGTNSPYPLQPLCYEFCWDLFKQLAFGEIHNNSSSVSSPCVPLELLQSCQEVVKLCKGVPSVLAAMGFLLRSCHSIESQSGFFRRLMSYDRSTSPISSVLLWEYYGLSSTYLKQCLVYCSLFPKGYWFEKQRLVLLWMAEGFLQPKGGMTLEDVGYSYFDELVERSFFKLKDDEFIHDVEPIYLMLDPVHVLAEYISSSGDEYFKLDDSKERPSSSSEIYEYARHSSLRCMAVSKDTFEAFHKSKGLHTLLLCDDIKGCLRKIPQDLFMNLTCIRVLDLSHAGLLEFPDSICHLTHLKFLDLSMNYIKYFPKKISMLHNLQTFRIISEVRNSQFSESMGELLSLRHLDMGNGYIPFNMPPGLEKLVNLQTMRAFTMDGKFGTIGVLRKLVNLRGSLVILDLGCLWLDEELIKGGCLIDKKLKKLELVWRDTDDAEFAEKILSCLEPHTNLKHLMVHSYGGFKFPAWISNRSFSNLETIELSNSDSCDKLPPLGQLPLLKSLIIHGDMSELKYIDSGFCVNNMDKTKGFPSLETLELRSLPCLETWTGLVDGDMPRLKKLIISSCDMLTSLPTLQFLKSLQLLSIDSCQKLQDFPDESPPSSLDSVVIYNCPLLEECAEKKHQNWWKIINAWLPRVPSMWI